MATSFLQDLSDKLRRIHENLVVESRRIREE